MEAGGSFDFSGGGSYITYVKAGASYSGASGGQSIVIHEPGAGLSNMGGTSYTFVCPTLTCDLSNAPAAGCQ